KRLTEKAVNNQATFRFSYLQPRRLARLTIAVIFSPLTNLRPLNPPGHVGVQWNLRATPASSTLARSFIASYRPRELNDGRAFYSRILINRAAHTYLGYELILELQQQTGAYLVTFGKLGITPLDVTATYAPRLLQNPPDEPFTMLLTPALPQ